MGTEEPMSTDQPSDHEFRLLSWNVGRSSIERLESQLTALGNHTPDIVALQEVGVRASRRPRQILRQNGFEYTAHSHEFRSRDFDSASGCAFASRWPFRVLDPETFDMPFQHHSLSAVFYTPFGPVEGHTVHVMPGSMVDEEKVEMFEGMYDRLAVEDPPKYRFLCGDFNSPKSESSDGEVTVWGSDDRWIDAERSVIVDLAEFDLADAYRAVNGYGDDAYSYVDVNNGTESRRRFDHAFASERLGPVAAEYLHQYDDLSDHTPLAVLFQPLDGLDGEADSVDRESFHSDDAGTDAGGERRGSRSDYPGLDYDVDQRKVDPDQNHRLGRFKTGWNRANDGAEIDDVLAELTWQNLGWRFGRLLGPASEDLQTDLYQWCVEQQLEEMEE